MTGLREAGFQAVATHFSSKAIRTDAPAGVVEDVMRKTVENLVPKCKKRI
jgi:tRNA G26 N,N-dimethylase Trm1